MDLSAGICGGTPRKINRDKPLRADRAGRISRIALFNYGTTELRPLRAVRRDGSTELRLHGTPTSISPQAPKMPHPPGATGRGESDSALRYPQSPSYPDPAANLLLTKHLRTAISLFGSIRPGRATSAPQNRPCVMSRRPPEHGPARPFGPPGRSVQWSPTGSVRRVP